MSKRIYCAALCLGLLLSGGHRLQAEEPERQQWAELKAKMETEGWTEITAGVFERWRGGNKVEHLGYGREGLVWHIGELTRQLETMMQEYEVHPSENLDKIVDNLSVMISKAKLELRNKPEGLSLETAALAGPSCSEICYSATADAYPLITVQGVGAIADAKFSSTCGYSGETYAYAYAKATKNGTTATSDEEDPDAGTSITSYAAASMEGASVSGVPCYSTANAFAQSMALNIHYSTSDTNDLCPAPLNASITSGPTSVPFTTATCSTQTWDATATDGVSPYTYKWYVNNIEVGTGSSYSRSVCYNNANFALKVVCTDANGGTDSESRTIGVSYTPPAPVSVSISGPSSASFTTATCATKAWTASAVNGTPPYTYTWYINNDLVGTGSSFSGSVCYNHPNFPLKVVATDANGVTDDDSRVINVSYTPLKVSMSTPSSVPFTTATCATKSWTASATGGDSPYAYKWYVNNSQVGTGTTYSRSVCYNHADFTLKVTGTDSSSPVQTDSATRNIDVSYTPPSVSVTINGSTYEEFYSIGCRNVTWTSTASGGTSPYTYQWKYNGTNVGTASSYTRSVCHSSASFTLSLTVTDSVAVTGSDTHSVDVYYEPMSGCSMTAAGQVVCP